MDRRVRRLMAEHFVEQRVRRRMRMRIAGRRILEEPAREGDLGAGGAVGAERAAEARAGSQADALREERRLPERGPGGEAGVERFEMSGVKLGHGILDSTPARARRSAAGRCGDAGRAAPLFLG